MGEPVRVGVVARDPMLEAGATSALHGYPDVEVVPVGSARVAVVLVDDVDDAAVRLVRDLRAAGPEVVLVANELVPTAALAATVAGARGLLRRREASADRLARTVLAAAAGDCTVPPDLLDRLLEHGVARAGPVGPGLSEREREVLRLVAEGHETSEIARRLSYSPRTVTGIVHGITTRFRLRNRAHAVAYALRAGLL
ncbi:helix-turn-helix transcriptional regulator [Actinophytocola gossypii]|uniref:Response regulator transcription factor n=1 Tax=Actinophytocola gossypii TaxID=2812003 RepID=A0ABT2JDW0_9PSEU|nr:LuxR C-terminal-related transcriptional regulator [Actinophytocola gossypii]MCT2585459.1 response regulator transcription factor [Actinophytocola gossypii]